MSNTVVRTAAARAVSNGKLVKKLLSIPGVTFVGVGKKTISGKATDEDAIIVGVVTKVDERNLNESIVIPKEIGKVRTDVVETGVITLKSSPDPASGMSATPRRMTVAGSGTPDRCTAATQTDCASFMHPGTRTIEHNPAPGGVSIGHHDITAGTLGMLVTKNGTHYILSNNHVLADCNQGDYGDEICQPGPYDGGKQTRATLYQFIPIRASGETTSQCKIAAFVCDAINVISRMLGRATFLIPIKEQSGDNLVDCALAEPVDVSTFSKCVMEVGLPGTTIIEPVVGMDVKKSGRTTGLTKGKITAVNVTAQVLMGDWIAVFIDQIAMTHMVDGGDSGSILFEDTPENNVVGLCFAGSDNVSFANRFSNVVDALGLEGFRT